MELQNVVRCWEMEKVRTTEFENELQKLTLVYQKDVEVQCDSKIKNNNKQL